MLIDERDKSEFGRGVAWGSAQSELFLANMRLHTLGLKGGLIEKIKRRAGISESRKDEDLPDDFLFQQRRNIGEVLHEDFIDYIKIAEKRIYHAVLSMLR